MQINLKDLLTNDNDNDSYNYHTISHKLLLKNRQSNQPGSPFAKLSIDFKDTVTVSLAKKIVAKFNDKSTGIKILDYSLNGSSIVALAGLFGLTPKGRYSNSLRKALMRTVNSNKSEVRKIMPDAKLDSLSDYRLAFYKLVSKLISDLLKRQNTSANSSSAKLSSVSKINCCSKASSAANSASISASASASAGSRENKVLNLYGAYYLNSVASGVRALAGKFLGLKSSARSCSSSAADIKSHQTWLSASNSYSAYVSASTAIVNTKISCSNETRKDLSYVCSLGDSTVAIREKRNSKFISNANKKLSNASNAIASATRSVASASSSLSQKSIMNSIFKSCYEDDVDNQNNRESKFIDAKCDFRGNIENACDELEISYSTDDNLQTLTNNFVNGLTELFSRLQPIRRLIAEELYRLNPNLKRNGIPTQALYYGLASGRYVLSVRNHNGQIRQLSGVRLLIHEFSTGLSVHQSKNNYNLDNFDDSILNNNYDDNHDNNPSKGDDNKGPDGPEP